MEIRCRGNVFEDTVEAYTQEYEQRHDYIRGFMTVSDLPDSSRAASITS